MNIQLPNAQRNYTLFDQNKVASIVEQKERALPFLKLVLESSKDEKLVVESLYIIDRMIDQGVKGIPAMYPTFSKLNNTKSPNIQTFLAGIYRKTQVPDAFGPLVSMLIKNSLKEQNAGGVGTPPYTKTVEKLIQLTSTQNKGLQPLVDENTNNKSIQAPFDPNEEIGGAILEYIKSYSNNPKKIDYTA